MAGASTRLPLIRHGSCALLAALLALAALTPPAIAQEGPAPPPGGAPHETADTTTPPPGPPPDEEPALPEPPADVDLPAVVDRISGSSRYATAGLLGTLFEPGGTVFIADGHGFADALAGGPAAALEDAPILLVARSGVPADTRDALEELRPSRIVVLGGPGVVTPAVAAELGQWAPVQRVSGPDRYATSAALSRRAFPEGARGVLVATGRSFPDALSGATRGAAFSDPLPILLVEPGGVPSATRAEIERLAPDFVLVLGGPAVVGEAVMRQLQPLAATVSRVSGASRYETSARIAEMYDGAVTPVIFLATGTDFPDALAAAPVVGYFDGPTLLVPPRGPLPEATVTALSRFTGASYVIAVGGGAVLDDDVLLQVEELVNGSSYEGSSR